MSNPMNGLVEEVARIMNRAFFTPGDHDANVLNGAREIVALPAISSLTDELERVRSKVAQYEAPGGWRPLADADARRVLGDPSVGVFMSSTGEIGHG
jgi:hypothetical protein